MASVYFYLFGAMGALVPFLPLYYDQLGLSGTQVAVLSSVLPVLLFVSQPIFGPLTDRSGHRSRVLGYLLLAAGVAGGLMALGGSFWTLLPLVVLWGFFAGPLVAIADSIALGEVMRTGTTFPQLRLWGSLSFLILSAGLGLLYSRIDLRWSFAVYALLNVGAWYVARRQPRDGLTADRKVWSALGRLLKNPALFGLLLCTAVMQMTLAANSAFYSIHVRSVGGSSGTVGLAWAVAALVEVPVWLVLGRVTTRTGPLPLLIFSSCAYAIRWWLYSVAVSSAAMVALQVMQGLTFAIFMPTAVVMVAGMIPQEMRTSGQALLNLVNGGIATVAGNLAAGRIVDRVGTAGMYRVATVVALVSALGFVGLLIHKRRETSHD